MPRQQVIDFRKASPAADVWAFAACIYHTLTGRTPREFPRAKDPWQVVLQEPAIPIRRRDPAIPRRLAEVIDTALREHPEIGCASAAELRGALERAGR
ncbi:hypothetical protein [Streptomyces sp. NPDC021212]|uniref:hypothetical protein n=1 Tax=Streptomyces sp. NPDC021212 TaxID=3365118 RepID=UPI0037B23B85